MQADGIEVRSASNDAPIPIENRDEQIPVVSATFNTAPRSQSDVLLVLATRIVAAIIVVVLGAELAQEKGRLTLS